MIEQLEDRVLMSAQGYWGADGRFVIRCGSGNDTVQIAQAGNNVMVTATKKSWWFNGGNFRKLRGFHIELGGGNDMLLTNASLKLPVLARGGAGNDIIQGGGSNDALEGGPGDDRIDASFGADLVHGGPGRDLVSYERSTRGVKVSLDGLANDGPSGYGNVKYVENVRGTRYDDILLGSSEGNVIEGLAGRDLIGGGSGHDELFGGDGDDRIFGDSGVDVIVGGNGRDWVAGGVGSDRINTRDAFADTIHRDVQDLVEFDARDRFVIA